MDEKVKTMRFSLVSNAALLILKLIVGIAINSVSVVAEAVHSGLDMLASLVTFLSVREASKPADAEHHYGHGKFENLAGILESLFILVTAGAIIADSVLKLAARRETVHSLGWGIGVMAFSAAVNWFVSAKLLSGGRRFSSPALKADGLHLRTDVYTSLGVFLSLFLIYLTGYTFFDPLVALFVSLFIIKTAYDLARDALRGVLDARLPREEEKVIMDVLNNYSGYFLDFHELRTRQAGSRRYIDLHLVVPQDRPIGEVHELCDRIEAELSGKMADCEVLIHTEPCAADCVNCLLKENSMVKQQAQCRSISCPNCLKRDN